MWHLWSRAVRISLPFVCYIVYEEFVSDLSSNLCFPVAMYLRWFRYIYIDKGYNRHGYSFLYLWSFIFKTFISGYSPLVNIYIFSHSKAFSNIRCLQTRAAIDIQLTHDMFKSLTQLLPANILRLTYQLTTEGNLLEIISH